MNKTFNSTSNSHEKSVWRDSWNNSIKYFSNFKFSKNLFSFFFERFSFRKDNSSVFFIDIDHSYLDFLSDKFKKFIKDSFLISIFYSRVVDRSKLRQWDESLDTVHIDQKSSKVCLSRNNSDDFIFFELCNNWLPYVVLEESSYWNDVVSIFVSYSRIDNFKFKFCRWIKIKLRSFEFFSFFWKDDTSKSTILTVYQNSVLNFFQDSSLYFLTFLDHRNSVVASCNCCSFFSH